MHHIHDDVETALAEHTRRPDDITGGHTGRGLARQRVWAHGHHDQASMLFARTAYERVASLNRRNA